MTRLFRLLLALSSLPLLAAAPRYGHEVPVSAPRVVPADRAMLYASGDVLSIASNGSMAVAVWEERRSANESDIFATRIDAAGHVLDPFSIAVTATNLYEENAHAVWDGRNFVLAWNSVATTSSNDRNVWTAALDTDGHFVAPPTNLGPGYLDDAAFSNGVVALAVRTTPNSYTTSSINLVLLSGSAEPLTVPVGAGFYARLTATRSGFAVAWQLPTTPPTYELHVARVAANGAVEQRDTKIAAVQFLAVQAIAAREDDVFLITGGASFLLYHIAGTGAVDVTTISTTPTLSGASSDLLVTADGFTALAHQSVGSGQQYVLRLSTSGQMIDSQPLATKNAMTVKLALLGGRTYVASSTASQQPANVYGQFAGETSATLLSGAAESQQTPVLASDGERLLAVWSVAHGYAFYATRGAMLSLNGVPLGEPFDIFPDRLLGGAVAAIFDGHDYIVVRVENLELNEANFQGLVATHVSRDGVPRGDRTVISGTVNQSARPSLATDGTNVLIAWTDGGAANAKYALLTPAGPAAPVTMGSGFGLSVAWNGTTYAAALSGHLTIARISRDGALTATTPLDVTDALAPSIASNGDGFLVAYTSAGRLEALPLDRDAKPAGPAQLVSQTVDAGVAISDQRLTWNGATYEAAWTEITIQPYTYFHDAYGARVRPDGILASDVFAISVTPADDSAPVPFGLGGGQTIIAYSRMVTELGQSARVFTRASSPPPRRRATLSRDAKD